MKTRTTVIGTLVGTLALAGATFGFTMSGEAKSTESKSGVEKGGMLSAFHPTHVSGPDKKTNTCPVCKYPENPAVQVWVNNDDPKNVEKLVSTLEKSLEANKDKKMKAFVIYLNPGKKSGKLLEKDLTAMAKKNKIERVSIAYLTNPKDEAISEYKINTDAKVKNTVFVYKEREVKTKFVNLVADEKGLEELNQAITSVNE